MKLSHALSALSLSLTLALTLSLAGFTSAHASVPQVKKLVCENSDVKFGLDSSSGDLFQAGMTTSDSDLFKKENMMGMVGMKYEPATGEFSGMGEEGCTALDYRTETDSTGTTRLIETEVDTGSDVVFVCRKL